MSIVLADDTKVSLVDLRGVGTHSFNFMQFLGEFGNCVFTPLPHDGSRPHLGKSWIRHYVLW